MARGRLADGGVATAVRDVASAARDVDMVARGEALTVTPVGRLALSSLAAEVLFIFFLGEPEHKELKYGTQGNGSIERWTLGIPSLDPLTNKNSLRRLSITVLRRRGFEPGKVLVKKDNIL